MTTNPVDAPVATGGAGHRAARILSDVFAPWVSVLLICLLTGTVARPAAPLAGTLTGGLIGTLCAVVPMAAIHLAVRRQRLSDRHVTRREQRWPVFLVCLGSVLLAVGIVALTDGTALFLWALATMLGGLVVTGSITLAGVKVSMHAFCFVSLVLFAAILVSPWALLGLPVLFPGVAYARLRLRHHTLVELSLGLLLAVLVVLTAWLFMPDVP